MANFLQNRTKEKTTQHLNDSKEQMVTTIKQEVDLR